MFTSYKYKKKNKQTAGVLIIMSAVGICALPACADVTRRQQESGGERAQTEQPD